jgi:hypothetical protein
MAMMIRIIRTRTLHLRNGSLVKGNGSWESSSGSGEDVECGAFMAGILPSAMVPQC